MIIRTALTTSAASLASVTQDTLKTAEAPAKVVLYVRYVFMYDLNERLEGCDNLYSHNNV